MEYIPCFNKSEIGDKKQQKYNAQVLIHGNWSFIIFTIDPRPLYLVVVPTWISGILARNRLLASLCLLDGVGPVQSHFPTLKICSNNTGKPIWKPHNLTQPKVAHHPKTQTTIHTYLWYTTRSKKKKKRV